MISERQKDILKAIIEEHIKMAEPIGSKAIAGKRCFGISAAMIRKEMNHLEKEGYLVQPHTSAGRVPTDQAYRLYIQEQLRNVSGKDGKSNKPEGLTLKESEKVNESLRKHWPDDQSLLKEVSHIAADISKELSVTGTINGEIIFSHGFSSLVADPEFKNLESMSQLMHLMDNIDLYFDTLWEEILGEGWNVFIGRENPMKEIDELSLITGCYRLPCGENAFVSIIGPKRMNYRRNVALVECISSILKRP